MSTEDDDRCLGQRSGITLEPRPCDARFRDSARAALPDANYVSGGISESRYPQVALRVRPRDNLAALSDNLLQRLIDPLDEDVGQDAPFASNRQVGHEVPDHVRGAVLEARIVPVGIDSPAEHGLVKRRRTTRLARRNPQIRDPATPEDARLFPISSTHNAIIGHRQE
jgi:hypothetical protein